MRRVLLAIITGIMVGVVEWFALATFDPLLHPSEFPVAEAVVHRLLFLDNWSLAGGLAGCIVFWAPTLVSSLVCFTALSRRAEARDNGGLAVRPSTVLQPILCSAAGVAVGVVVYYVAAYCSSDSAETIEVYGILFLWAGFVDRLDVSHTVRALLGWFPFLMVFGPVVATAVGLAHVFRCRMEIADTEQVCGTCGYNLRGNISGVCPECGSEIPPSESKQV